MHLPHSADRSGGIRKEHSDGIASKGQRPVRASLFRCPEAVATKEVAQTWEIEKSEMPPSHFSISR